MLLLIYAIFTYRGSDLENLVEFLYTGRTSLKEKEFASFQQLICELQIVTDGDKAIILEEVPPITNVESSGTKESSLEKVY